MTDAKPPTTESPATVTKPVTAKPVGKKTQVTETIVVKTTAFDVSTAVRVDEAKDLFLLGVRESYGDAPISDVRLIKVNHHIGKSATYHFAATIGG